MKFKTILKIIIALSLVGPALWAMVYHTVNAENIPFESVCEPENSKFTEEYCKNVGKRAVSIKNVSAINNTDYGKIVGVVWRERDSIISAPGQKLSISTSKSYYYIIAGDKKGYYFLRIVNEIAAKDDASSAETK